MAVANDADESWDGLRLRSDPFERPRGVELNDVALVAERLRQRIAGRFGVRTDVAQRQRGMLASLYVFIVENLHESRQRWFRVGAKVRKRLGAVGSHRPIGIGQRGRERGNGCLFGLRRNFAEGDGRPASCVAVLAVRQNVRQGGHGGDANADQRVKRVGPIVVVFEQFRQPWNGRFRLWADFGQFVDRLPPRFGTFVLQSLDQIGDSLGRDRLHEPEQAKCGDGFDASDGHGNLLLGRRSSMREFTATEEKRNRNRIVSFVWTSPAFAEKFQVHIIEETSFTFMPH